MTERFSEKLLELIQEAEGKNVTYAYLRKELRIDPMSPAWDGLREQMRNLTKRKIVKPLTGHIGTFKVITQVQPVQVFGRERKQPIEVFFPRDYDTGHQMLFADDIVLREGDLILVSGRSNYGKTTLCMNFCGENIDKNPVLMGNEYTTVDHAPSPRFLTRIDDMDWIDWADEEGNDRFTLLPVRSDYAEHIVRDKINIIDWINLDAGSLYEISRTMEDIKRELGKGIGIVAIQKGEGAESGRGGQFTKDFTDCELLIDGFGENEVMLKIGKVKESTQRVVGRTFAYRISKGVRILNFREIVQCRACWGKGWQKSGNSSRPCDECRKTGFVDK